jgi:hypothetical protein
MNVIEFAPAVVITVITNFIDPNTGEVMWDDSFDALFIDEGDIPTEAVYLTFDILSDGSKPTGTWKDQNWREIASVIL